MKVFSKIKNAALAVSTFALTAPVMAANNQALGELGSALDSSGDVLGWFAGPAAGIGAAAVGYTFVASEQGQGTKTAMRIMGGAGIAYGGYKLMTDVIFTGLLF